MAKIRAAAFVSNTIQEKEAHLKLIMSVKVLNEAQVDVSEQVHIETEKAST